MSSFKKYITWPLDLINYFILQAMVYSICVYFLAGLSLRGTQFLMYLLLLFLVAYFGSSVFFFLSAVSSIPEVGNAFAGTPASEIIFNPLT